MGVVRFKLDRKGIQALVSSDEAQGVVTEVAEELRARAGDGFKVHSSNKGKRARAYVRATLEDGRVVLLVWSAGEWMAEGLDS